MGPTTGTAAAAAPNQRHQSRDRAQRAAPNRTVGPPTSAASPTTRWGLVSLVLLVFSRCVSRSRPTEVHRREAQRWRLRVGLGLRQLVRECEGQQRELGQLEQHQQRGGRPGRWRSHALLQPPLHYLIKKKYKKKKTHQTR